ncbi:hypothetical protein T05_3160 [Trichinella murrelli]|uniref:Uncharacterized protein n=1 Tax=Trichinella murrelli TaxID=144512 RepID=A0A0V0T7E7_9BILA|nr:hypothetical protein T05_3160 [Trichinella murrelli]
MLNESVTFHKFLQESSILPDCFTKFAYKTASTIKKVLFTVHQAFYTVTVIRITKVKWYGPRIAHLAVDLQCKPIMIISCEQLIRRKRTVQTVTANSQRIDSFTFVTASSLLRLIQPHFVAVACSANYGKVTPSMTEQRHR